MATYLHPLMHPSLLAETERAHPPWAYLLLRACCVHAYLLQQQMGYLRTHPLLACYLATYSQQRGRQHSARPPLLTSSCIPTLYASSLLLTEQRAHPPWAYLLQLTTYCVVWLAVLHCVLGVPSYVLPTYIQYLEHVVFMLTRYRYHVSSSRWSS